ncbi:hypothetical protein [Acrocarpospora catenulata]|uniref:hypothetical protein n=1 Tax=Acrocarpospora catenulata TaxID=2836182 RepID=UPI001BDA153C|nr:hypothetical protein [Acrocarpospora catenulata]
MSDDKPEFGYGQGLRPLWSARDRDAERIREALRGAGLVEFSDSRAGFVVEGGGDGRAFLVVFAGPGSVAGQRVASYAGALAAAGMRAEPDADDDQAPRVWLPS